MRLLPLLLSAALFVLPPAFAEAQKAFVVADNMSTGTTTPVAAAPLAQVAFTDAQKTEIEGIIKDYLINKHPEVMMDGLQELQKRQTADAAVKTKTALSSNKDKVFNDPSSPVGGNPKGDVTVVEFFDYQCGYCKLAEPNVEKLLKEDKEVRYVYKEFPILGPTSVVASKAALASIRQGLDKYFKFHAAMMAAQFTHGQQQAEDEATIYRLAKNAGLNVDQLKKDMNDDATVKIVDANVQLGSDIGARGTPTFIIGDNVLPGAMEYDALKKAVADQRALQQAKK